MFSHLIQYQHMTDGQTDIHTMTATLPALA